MPLKARTGRDSTKIDREELKDSTAAFLKTDKKFEFYWVDNKNEPTEIPPVEAFKIFEAEQKEQRVDLIENHHEHVKLALDYFEKVEQLYVQTQTDPKALGAVAQRAKKFLSEVVKYPPVTDIQKENIKKIITLIDIGKFANLSSDIGKIQKQKLNLKDNLVELDEIARKYNVDISDTQIRTQRSADKPVLIISESFI